MSIIYLDFEQLRLGNLGFGNLELRGRSAMHAETLDGCHPKP